MAVESGGAGSGWVHWTEIDPWAGNPNLHPDQQPETIAESIRAFGFVSPVVVWPARGQLVAGHGRLQAMRLIAETGYTYTDATGTVQTRAPDPDFAPFGAPGPGMIRVVRHDFPSEAAAHAYCLADNEIARRATWDEDAVAALVRSLSSDFGALHAIGFPADELQRMLSELGELDPGPLPAPLPEPEEGGSAPVKTDRVVLVDLVIPMSPDERAECQATLNRIRAERGLDSVRAAALEIFRRS